MRLLLTLFIISVLPGKAIDVYLIPGLGVDERVYERIHLHDTNTIHLLKHVPTDSATSMQEYARKYVSRIDTTKPFVLVGLSLGGMIAMEMTDYVQPFAVVLISSSCNRQEVPWRYKALRYFPIYWFIGANSMKMTAFLFPFVSPLKDDDKKLYSNMIRDHDPKFLRNHIHYIAHWKRENCDSTGYVYHIHGEYDPIIPVRKIRHIDTMISGGKHKLLLTHSSEVSLAIDMSIKKAAH